MQTARRASSKPTLRRALGRWDLTAIGVNQVIGGAVFLMPAQIAGQVGTWSPVGFVLVGFASLLVALCFAEVGSRFDRAGGAYLYARSAFGRFVGFEVGWMQWFTRVASQASVMSGIAMALGFYWPDLTRGWSRSVLLTLLTGGLTIVNVRGIRQSAWLVNGLTIGKLLPLALFVMVGLFQVDPALLFRETPPISIAQASAAALLLIFVFGGYDVIAVPAAEAERPHHDVPFALMATIAIVTVVFTCTQLVAQGTLSNLAEHATPVADAALVIMGAIGGLLVGAGSVVSMTGNNAGQILTGSRMLFALAETGEFPEYFAKIDPRYRTPARAIVFTSAIALLLALTGSFVTLAIASAVARLVIYTSTCLATLALRRARHAEQVRPASFVLPFGSTIPLLATALSVAMIAGATSGQLLGGAATLLVGVVIFATNRRYLSNTGRTAEARFTWPTAADDRQQP